MKKECLLDKTNSATSARGDLWFMMRQSGRKVSVTILSNSPPPPKNCMIITTFYLKGGSVPGNTGNQKITPYGLIKLANKYWKTLRAIHHLYS